MKKDLVIFWCRRDFRLHDNPALSEAILYAQTHNLQFLPLYILDAELLNSQTNIGYPRRTLLSHILSNFGNKFSSFLVTQGNPLTVFKILTESFNIHVFLNSDIEPYARKRDNAIFELIQHTGGSYHNYRDQLTISPKLRSGSGSIYSVFTPFRNASLQEFVDAKVYPQVHINSVEYYPHEIPNITRLQLDRNVIFDAINIPWSVTYTDRVNTHVINLDELFERKVMDELWQCDEDQVIASLETFIQTKLNGYKTQRDSLELDTLGNGQTSKMSTALKWGLISSRYITQQIIQSNDDWRNDVHAFHYISELMWREFYRYILYHCPEVLDNEFQPKSRSNLDITMVTDNPNSILGSHTIDWVNGNEAHARFTKWIQGETGYPVVDAAMNQLIQTGWMHNRSRMIVASILTKNLGIDWRWGQEYFRAMLVDLDEASNNGGWQWAGSVGADPKPIRIFNPHTQESKFDPHHLYINTWLPKNYSITKPYIEHTVARQEGLKRYKLMQDTPSVRDY